MGEETPADQTNDGPSPEAAPVELTEDQVDEVEPAETDFARNIWLLLVVLAVVAVAGILSWVWAPDAEITGSLLPPNPELPPAARPAPPGRSPAAPRPVASQPGRLAPAGPSVSRIVGSEREIILAAPSLPVAPGEVVYRRPRFFDVTDRTEGFELKDLVRLPDRWANQWPSPSVAEAPDPAFVAAADMKDLGAADRVVVVSVGAVTRAYPIQGLRVTTGVRDQIGETPIFVCWSTTLQRAQCLLAQVGESGLGLRDAGLLYRGTNVLYDEDTGSLWDPIRGRALAGPHAGGVAQRLPAEVWPWEELKERQPDTPVLTAGINPLGPGGEQAERGLAAYLQSPGLPMTPVHFDPAAAPVPAKSYVLGVVAGGEAKAYSLPQLEQGGVETLEDSVGGVAVQVHVTSARTGYVTAQGELEEAATMLWFAWKEDHPDTQIHETAAPAVPDVPAAPAAPEAAAAAEEP